MDFLLYYLFPFSALSIIYGITEHNKNKYKIKRLARFRKFFTKEYFLSSMIWLNVTLMFIAKCFHFNTTNHPVILYVSLFIIFALGASLITILFNIIAIVKKFEKILSFSLGVIGLLITILTLAYADGLITEKTTLSANLFPVAQKIITLAYAPFFWSFVVFLILFIVYFLLGALACIKSILQIDYFSKCYKSLRVITNLKYTPKNLNLFIDQAAFLSSLIIIMTVPKVIYNDLYNGYLNKNIVNLIILSSFDKYQSVCEEHIEKETYIHYLDTDLEKVVLAKKEKESYVFELSKCTRIQQKKKLTKN